MGRIRGRDALVGLVIAVLAGATAALPPFKPLRGWSIDALTALRWRIFGNRFEPASSPTVVIALDEETYRTPPFENLSTSFMTGEIGRAITAAIDGGARVVGLDIVFPTSVELSTLPYREGTLGALLPGFDSDFLGSLYDGGHAGKLVLGWIQLGEHVFLPAPAQRLAVGGNDNLHSRCPSIPTRSCEGFL
jgi:adenylate cyclase